MSKKHPTEISYDMSASGGDPDTTLFVPQWSSPIIDPNGFVVRRGITTITGNTRSDEFYPELRNTVQLSTIGHVKKNPHRIELCKIWWNVPTDQADALKEIVAAACGSRNTGEQFLEMLNKMSVLGYDFDYEVVHSR